MSKLTIAPVQAGYRSAEALTQNFEAIEAALENTLSRDGTSPNQMGADLDMNSNRIINLPAPLSPTEPARLGDLEAIDLAASGLEALVAEAEEARDETLGALSTKADIEHVHTIAQVTGLQTALLDMDDFKSGVDLFALGEGAFLGGTRNTAVGYYAGNSQAGDYNTFLGSYAGLESVGNFNTILGALSAEEQSGGRNVTIGPVAMRYHVGDGCVGIGFAAGENVDGSSHIFIGDHAGVPPYTEYLQTGATVNVGANTLSIDTPVSNPPAVGKVRRFQFANGSGAVPGPLTSPSESVLGRVVSIGGGKTVFQLETVTLTTAGTAGWIVGMPYYLWDNVICLGNNAPDGPNQVSLGSSDTREMNPPNDGLVSLGRSPIEAATYGFRGTRRWRGMSARYGGVWANAGEPAFWDFGRDTGGGAYVRRWSWDYNTSNNLNIARYNSSGVFVDNVFSADPTSGAIKLPNQPAIASMLGGASGVIPNGGGYTNLALYATLSAATGLNTTTGEYTAPVTGRYRAMINVGMAGGNTGQGTVTFHVNGSPVGAVADMIGVRTMASVEWIFWLTAGDLLKPVVNADTGTVTLRNNGVGAFTVDFIG